MIVAASGASAQQRAIQQRGVVELEGNVITVPSPLVVDSRQVDPIATPLRFDGTYFEAIDRAQRVNIHGFPLDRTTRIDLEVENFEVLMPEAVVVRGGVNGNTPVDVPAIALLRGRVVGIPDSKVYLAISPRMSNGIIEIEGTTHIVSNGSFERQTGISIYNQTDLPVGAINWVDYACTLIGEQNQAVASRGDGDMEQPCRRADMAIETDNEFARLFSTDPLVAQSATIDYVQTLVGAVSEIYTEQWNMHLFVAFLRQFPDDNIADPWEGLNTPQVLTELNAIWTEFSAPYEGEWNGVHLFSGKPLGGGIAYLNAICNLNIAQAVSGNLSGFFPNPLESNNNQNWDVVVTAHEWGHNFGAPHTHGLIPPHDQCGFGNCAGAEDGTIMSYCHLCPGGLGNIALTFADRIMNEGILPYVTLEMPCDLIELDLNECEGSTECLADVNGDGMLSPADFTAWIIAYNAGDSAADINRNGTLEAADFTAWLVSWQSGCTQ